MSRTAYNSNIKSAKRSFSSASKRSREAIGVFVVGEAQLRAPVDTGNLKNSYTHRVEADRVHIGTNTKYAIYVELGTGVHAENGNGRKTPWAFMGNDGNWYFTRGSKPQPHLRPAFTQNRERIKKLVAGEFRWL